jgi:hypothetical protein
MKLKFRMKQELTYKRKKNIFYLLLLLLSCILFLLASITNSTLNDLLSNYTIIIKGNSIPKLEIIIAPIVEECIKLFGYAVLLLLPLKARSWMDENQKNRFIENNIVIAFIISAGGFGFFEGFAHNLGFNTVCFIAFVSLNVLIHMTYSIYPFVLGRKYRNSFFAFLPIAILLHAIHNFILRMVWDNKWVSFMMVTFLLIPLLFLERDNIANIAKRLFSRIQKWILSIVFVVIYIYIFLCCL